MKTITFRSLIKKSKFLILFFLIDANVDASNLSVCSRTLDGSSCKTYTIKSHIASHASLLCKIQNSNKQEQSVTFGLAGGGQRTIESIQTPSSNLPNCRVLHVPGAQDQGCVIGNGCHANCQGGSGCEIVKHKFSFGFGSSCLIECSKIG